MKTALNKKSVKHRFPFDSKGLEEAHRFMIQTIIDHRSWDEIQIQCFFYTRNQRTPCSLIEFHRSPAKTRGVYGTKVQNEIALLRKMLDWKGEGGAIKSDVVGTLVGRNLPIRDFKRFRYLVEESGVFVEKSRLTFIAS